MTIGSVSSGAPSADPARGWAWPAVIAGTAVFGSLIAACMMPLVAVAVMAAATLPRRQGVATVLFAWGINQGLGFTLLGESMREALDPKNRR